MATGTRTYKLVPKSAVKAARGIKGHNLVSQAARTADALLALRIGEIAREADNLRKLAKTQTISGDHVEKALALLGLTAPRERESANTNLAAVRRLLTKTTHAKQFSKNALTHLANLADDLLEAKAALISLKEKQSVSGKHFVDAFGADIRATPLVARKVAKRRSEAKPKKSRKGKERA